MERADKEVTGVPRARRPEGEPADPAPDSVEEPRSTADRGPDELTDEERGLLDFEKQWWRHAGAKEQAIRDRFGVSATYYYQSLNALLDRPAAMAYDPVLVKRLQRLRSQRGPIHR